MWCCAADLTPMGFLINAEKGDQFQDNEWVTVKGTLGITGDGTGFYWLPPSLPGWAIPASDNKPSPENTNQKSPSVDCEQILKDFSDYASTETDKKKLIERYQRDWQLMAGNEEAQAKCVQVMNIRVNELKQAA